MIQKITVILFLVSILAFAKTDIIIYTECNNPPYSYCKEGEVKGISVDIYRAIFNKLSAYSLEVRGAYIDNILDKMKSSEIKVAGTLPLREKERPYIVEYTDSFIDRGNSLFCNKDINITDKKSI